MLEVEEMRCDIKHAQQLSNNSPSTSAF
uniref:Uncharacterized protein n=1 Tax=Rhizophora mucronata TaxID=61149 RepID=A0A2P2NCG7_RHIMU